MSRQDRDRDIAESLGDFTATPRLLLISLFATCIGVVGAFVALGLLKLIGLFTNLFFFQRFSTVLITPEAHGLGPFVIVVPVIGALIIGVHGALWIGTHSRPRHPRGDRSDSDQREPCGTACRDPQAAVVRDFNRVRRTVRRRRTDHHDRRRGGIAHRAVFSSHQRGTKDLARRGRGGRHVGDVCGAAGGGAAGRRVAAL